MATSVSVRPTTPNPMHQSMSVDEQNQYYITTNDDRLCMEYLNEISVNPQPQIKTEVQRLQTDQQPIPPARCSSAAGKHVVSPYLQKLPHSNYLQVIQPPPVPSTKQPYEERRRRRRRRSTSCTRTRDELLDAAYQPSNVDHLDLSSFFGQSAPSFSRPTSAPTRPLSQPARKRRVRGNTHKKSSYSKTFMITLYRNGDHDRCCYCKASSLNAILLYATEKLHMASAARRIFAVNGQEIFRFEDLQSNREYYVSSGENFKDPYKSIQIQTEYSLNSTWTMKGLQMDQTKPKSFTTKPVISDRLNKQIKTSTSLTIIENGFGNDDAVYHMLIDTVLKRNFDKFLDDCTNKLELTAHARKAYNYRGDEIKSLKIFLESDESEMKIVNNEIVYGPIWISKGERFRPTGAYAYLELRYNELNSEMKKLKMEYKEMGLVLKYRQRRRIKEHHNETDDDENDSSNETIDKTDEKPIDISTIKDKSLLSMKTKELKSMIKSYDDKMNEVKTLMTNVEEKMKEIEDRKIDEETSGAKFFVQHIKEVPFDDKIVGRHPLVLIIHENGSCHQSDPKISLNLRGLPSNTIGQTSIEYLLDYLQATIQNFSNQRPKRAFDIDGTEIKAIGQLKHKQHVFISFGEEFRTPFEPCLAIQLHSVDAYEKESQLILMKVFRMEDEQIGEHEKRSRKQLVAAWKPTENIENVVQRINYENDLDDEQKDAFDRKIKSERVAVDVTFLIKDSKLIYPELKINQILSLSDKPKSTNEKKTSKRVFSENDLQIWCYDKDGYIYNKQMSSLVLTVVPTQNVKLTWQPGKFEKKRMAQSLDGHGVQLKPKKTDLENYQIWNFTTDGFIVSKFDDNLALTSLATIVYGQDESFNAIGVEINENDPYMAYAGVCQKCSQNSPFIYRQRWAIRQVSGFTIGDWKYSKVENPLWHKMALTWPVDENGDKIPELQWPVEGCLIPNVPPIKSLKSSQAPATFVPIRLQVLKNGERDFSKAVSVVGPDISNLILEPKGSASMYRRLRIPEPEKEQRAHRQIKRMADARQREIKLFLENCTTLCNLPFAGRRLFDVNGTELFDLTAIKRDSYVYVTCGEQWIDPQLTKAEQQRRLLLAYLSHDVRMIFFYCALRYPTEYAIATEIGLCENSRLIINKCALNAKQRKRVLAGESIEQVIEHEEPVEELPPEPEPKTAHERSHKMIDQKSKEKFRWPWEKLTDKNANNQTDDDDVVLPSNDDQSLGDSFIPTADTLSLSKVTRKIPKSMSVSMQKFRWEQSGGYISCMDDANLVFGVKEIESKVVEVILKRRNPDDIFQRWLLLPCKEDEETEYEMDLQKPFLIVSKARPTMVLTVLLPSCTGNESNEVSISCVGCTVTLQQRRYEETGCANQKWGYEDRLGFIFPFKSNDVDLEITAANRANICSYTVNYEALSQPGFVVSILNTSDQAEDVPVCLACAHAMRGKYRLVKIEPNIKFTCAIGRRTDLKFQGPFRCLNHKVDLTRNEAENTLFQRQEQLEQLRQEASVRNIAKELAVAKSVQVVHLLAYRNGDGHTKAGQALFGSSIVGLLDQATYKLNLINAARRFYLIDGTVLLDVPDLIQWATEYYKKCYSSLVKPNENKTTNTTLLDRVDLNTPLPPKNSQRRPSTDNQSERTTFSAKLRDVSPSKDHFLNLPKTSDLKRAIKMNNAKRSLDIDIDYLLKFPIEVWVSSGEPFVKPSDVDQRQNQRFTQREQRTTVEHDLEKERHTLRLMKGRRISGQSPGEYKSQYNPDQPVVRQGHWTEKSDAELDKQDDVELLRSSLDQLRSAQQPEVTQPISTTTIERLGQYSRIQRVMVYLNGEPKETAIPCFGSTLDEVMSNAKLKWNLMQPVQSLFDENGQLIERFDQLHRDQYVCISTTKAYVTHSEKQHEVAVKANWARTRNKYGDQATDIRVSSAVSSIPQSVDPFGPPLLTLDDQTRPTSSKPPPVPNAPYRRLAIEPAASQIPKSAVINEVTPSPIVMKDSLVLSEDDDDDGPNSEIERITKSKIEDSEDSRPTTPRPIVQSKSPFSQLFGTQTTTNDRARNLPSTNKSDNGDDDFLAMLKRK